MKLQIEQREREKISILDLKGGLVLGEEDLSLLQRLLHLLDSRHHQVILNLKDVSNIDESGLDTLAFSAARFHDIGGRLVLLAPGKSHAHGADIAKLSIVSETYQEETEAVNSLYWYTRFCTSQVQVSHHRRTRKAQGNRRCCDAAS